ncbi:MAG: hypothetical protein WCD31_02125 [Gillisia sp.]
MTTYYNKSELHHSMKLLVENYFKECTNCKELSQDFVDLIKHNFLAKFVCYNQEKNTIDIGVENNESLSPYPEIQVYSYPVTSKKWLEESFKNDKCDLDFYGRLLNRQNAAAKNADVVVM